jgi:predicted ATPase
MFQVRAPGLGTEFPPLKTVDLTPGNLRPPTTSFIGRQTELAELATALKEHRLVTLTGVGGVGKTRLALEVASRISTNFADGVWVIEFASITDPAAVPEAVAAVLGITQQSGMSLTDSIAAALEGRSRLLVFDNCEHVLDAAADMIDAIFAHSTTVKVLATSREGLRLADERLWPVAPLDVRTGVDSTAATLFAERADAVTPSFSLSSSADADAVVEICRRLDGIPLGIELAASRTQSMTATEVRDRLDDRFRLLVGSRRGLERHQTLRHAVQWSYDLLDADEKMLLNRCSVFAGGFDLAGGCAVASSDDEFATLDLLDALVRKSLLIADRSSGRTRYSMLETIRQFAEEQLAQTGKADESRTAHANYFAGRETDVLVLWDSSRQREAYAWFTVELPNLRVAFRWAADHNDLDAAAAIAFYATLLGFWFEQHEPISWAEELITPAKAVGHPRLAQLYVAATQCYAAGRIEEAHQYAEAAQSAVASGRYDPVPYSAECWIGGGYIMRGQTERWAQVCRNIIERDPHDDAFARASLVIALTFSDAYEEAIAASEGLLAAIDAVENPHVVSYALAAYGFAHRDADPVAAFHALRRGMQIARESDNRRDVSIVATSLSRLAAAHGDPAETFDVLNMAIRNEYDSGSVAIISSPLAILAAFLDQLGHQEPAAIISGFASNPFTQTSFPEINTAISHLREVLGDETYESLARTGENMTTAAMAAYALEHINRAQAELSLAGESH